MKRRFFNPFEKMPFKIFYLACFRCLVWNRFERFSAPQPFPRSFAFCVEATWKYLSWRNNSGFLKESFISISRAPRFHLSARSTPRSVMKISTSLCQFESEAIQRLIPFEVAINSERKFILLILRTHRSRRSLCRLTCESRIVSRKAPLYAFQASRRHLPRLFLVFLCLHQQSSIALSSFRRY